MAANENSKPSGRNRTEVMARLRVAVGFLGEKDQYAWWPTSFLSRTGRRYLEFNFPRTVLSAGVSSVSHAAKELHDQRIGRGGVFHLFRLPHAFEQDLHLLLASEFRKELESLIAGRDTALAVLSELADGEDLDVEGAMRISDVSRVTHALSLRKLAGCYLSAFKNGKQTFPYFTAE